MDNLQINVVEKTVMKDACWTTLTKFPASSGNDAITVMKVTFDRTYPYFWLLNCTDFGVGVATSLEAIQAAAYIATDSKGNEHVAINLSSDGIFKLDFCTPACISLGPRRSFYAFTGCGSLSTEMEYLVDELNRQRLRISAQDTPVNPFGGQTSTI